MIRFSKRNFSFGAASAVIALAISQPAYADQGSQSGPQAEELSSVPGDIIVTAQRKSEKLQDTPLAITAISAESATSGGLRNMLDIKLATPGVDFTSSTGFMMLYMRGTGVQFVSPGLEPPVAVYIDNMYVPRTSGLNSLLDLVDPGSIEIIRGPQGTLYGRNATGGVIRVSSAAPTDRLEGRVMAEYGRFEHKQLDGMLNIPVSDDLSLRFAGRWRKEDGYVKNIDGKSLPEVNNYTVRARMKWIPSGTVDVVGGVEWQRSSANGHNDQLSLGAPSCYVCQTTGTAPLSFYRAAVNITSPYYNRAFRSDLRVSAELNDFTLTSTSTYFVNESIQNADNDFTPVDVFRYHVQTSGGRTFSQEFQLSYNNGGPLELLAAASYLNDKGRIAFSLEGSAFNFALFTGAYPKNSNFIKTESISGLLEANYKLTDTIKVTVGGRYTHDRRDQLVNNNAGFQLFGAPASYSANDTFNAFTPRFVLAWDNGPTNVFYSYTRGFKAGGFVSPSPFPGKAVDAEKAFNHEIGVKHSGLGGKLNLSLNAFFYKNKGLQQQVVDIATGGTITQNAGSSKGYGVEFEATYRPIDGLVIGGSIGYLHARYEEYRNASVTCFDPSGTADPVNPGATLYSCRKDLTGTPLPHSPDWTVSANASYTFAIGNWSASLAGLAQYRSESLFWPGAGGDLNHDRQPGYTIANFSGYVSPPGDNLRVGFYVDNAFNARYATIRSNIAPWGVSFNAGKPRTYGARVEYKF